MLFSTILSAAAALPACWYPFAAMPKIARQATGFELSNSCPPGLAFEQPTVIKAPVMIVVTRSMARPHRSGAVLAEWVKR
jgi:hypothetical protein